MAWRGLVTESKAYMGYPSCGRWKFWRAFPAACLRFYGYAVRDWVVMLVVVPVGRWWLNTRTPR